MVEKLNNYIETILIADDDRLILYTIAKGLREQGYTVIETNSGERAIEITADINPDLAILDMRMSGISGLDVARWLKANTATPYIFLTAYDDKETVEEAAAAGALGYLVKPVNVHQILPSIRSALARAMDIRKLHESEHNIIINLNTSRTISTAIGILMERQQIGQQQAFEIIRSSARNQRLKAVDIAVEIINR